MITPVADGVEAPGIEPARREVHPVGASLGSVPSRQIPRIESGLRATTVRGVRWRQRGEIVLAPFHPGVTTPASHAGGGSGEEVVAIRINKPPMPVHLFHSEEAGGFGYRVKIAAILAVAEIARVQAGFLGGPLLFELSQILDLAGPVGGNPLTELIHHRLGV